MEANAEILDMEKTKILLEMGFGEAEIFDAIDVFGHEVSMCEIADSIFASRFARRLDSDKEEESHDHRCKRAKNMAVAGVNEASCIRNAEERKQPSSRKSLQDSTPSSAKAEKPAQQRLRSFIKLYETNQLLPRSIKPGLPLSGPPFLFLGSTTDLPGEMLRKVSQLYRVELEFVNTLFFSAIIRKEGYVHNLPNVDRTRVYPGSPMTIEEALPHTKKWWPPWDTRKQLSCIRFDPSEALLLCQELENLLAKSPGMPSKEEQSHLLHHCKTMNLVWVAENKLGPLEPHQMERILGYPNQHTNVLGIEAADRMRKLMHGFQIDTLAYHLSALKGMFPKGVSVLSIADGIGGAEIALYRLGIPLSTVIAVEADETNRKIMKRWWQLTGQTGELLQMDAVEKLTAKKLESLIEKFGGFDLVIGGMLPGSRGSKNQNSVDLAMGLLYEFAHIFQQARRIDGLN